MTSETIRNFMGTGLAGVLLLCFATEAKSQNTPEMREVLSRLDRLEKDNQALTAEVRALRKELAAAKPEEPPSSEVAAAPEDRLAVEQSRVEELAQTKVESSQKFPIRITGMALFNAFLNGRHNNQADNPTIASLSPEDSTGAATLRQSTIGLLYSGPQMFGGGKVSGSLYLDFFGGSASSLNHVFRIRTAAIDLDWTNTSIRFGQDKPIISPRDPESLAQVGVSPLTSAGNPWLWQPQIRVEERFAFDSRNSLKAQLGVFQTSITSATTDPNAYVPPGASSGTEYSRPGLEGRVEFARHWGETEKLEIAGGFHVNRNHIGPISIPTNVYSVDWFVRPLAKLEVSGMYFHARNVSPLGALRQGFSVFPGGNIVPVRTNGGWAQIRLPVTARLAFNAYGGQQDDVNRDLLTGGIGKNQAYFGNMMYRLAPNVIVSLEGGQVRTAYYRVGNRLNDHYDLAIAYLF
jgi:hypothetical protein